MKNKVERNYLEIKSIKDLKDKDIISSEYSVKIVKPDNFQINKFFTKI